MDYEVKISETSREMSARERIKMKDFGNATQLDAACDEGSMLITPDAYVVLDIHNEHAKDGNTNYQKYVIIDKAGNKFVTGSSTFFKKFMEIWEEMSEVGEEYEIEVYKRPSQNYKGKFFLTCSIV